MKFVNRLKSRDNRTGKKNEYRVDKRRLSLREIED